MPPPSVPTSVPHLFQPYPTLSRSSSYLHNSGYSRASGSNKPPSRPRLTTTLWEDESTICYQVDCRGICVARRQDNNMINGTKLLNVAGMSRGKRDGILKNERGRAVVKVGAMHLKGVWIPFVRAKALATQFKILDVLYPIFSDDPASHLYPSHLHQMNRFNNSISSSNHHLNNEKSSIHSTHYKAYAPYPTSSSVPDLLATARESNSVIDDIVPQVNDTYSIYHHQQQQQQQEEPRGTNNSDLSCNQQQQQQYQGYQHQQRSDHSTTNVKSPSFLTDYSTVSINSNQDSVQKRLNYRHNQDQQGTVHSSTKRTTSI
ncbi:transcription regulator HTH, apses-type DNA-binding domain-containing protein [Parasitella parasitica]|nr:transcription regulator HTH, apses-type DNA-binding domain-containing protein [Parasitella parasitica]